MARRLSSSVASLIRLVALSLLSALVPMTPKRLDVPGLVRGTSSNLQNFLHLHLRCKKFQPRTTSYEVHARTFDSSRVYRAESCECAEFLDFKMPAAHFWQSCLLSFPVRILEVTLKDSQNYLGTLDAIRCVLFVAIAPFYLSHSPPLFKSQTKQEVSRRFVS